MGKAMGTDPLAQFQKSHGDRPLGPISKKAMGTDPLAQFQKSHGDRPLGQFQKKPWDLTPWLLKFI
ncbi:hypothetical protein CYJ37_20015 [Bacillus sp. UMB0728]|nr:hypothetical protein CYJ37_20015 [Bacillus sp. UMB0728]